MSPQARKAGPDPTPRTGIARRLEHIRHQHGVSSRRAFWQRVKDEWDEGEAGKPAPSYAAVKLWHYDREPPIAYLACVAKVFGIRFLWLLTGEGEMTEADQRSEDEVSAVSLTAMWRDLEERRARSLRIEFLQGLGALPDDFEFDSLSSSQKAQFDKVPYWLPLLDEARHRYGSGLRKSTSGKVLNLSTLRGHVVDFAAVGRALRALLDELAVKPAEGVSDFTYQTTGWLNECIAAVAMLMISLAPEHKRQRESSVGFLLQEAARGIMKEEEDDG